MTHNPRTDRYNDPTTTKGGHQEDDGLIRPIPTPRTIDSPNAVTPISGAPDQRAIIATQKIRINTPSIRKPAERNPAFPPFPSRLAVSPKVNPRPKCVKPHTTENIPAANLANFTRSRLDSIFSQHTERIVITPIRRLELFSKSPSQQMLGIANAETSLAVTDHC